jgi:predicted O-methyltransferase YrrM
MSEMPEVVRDVIRRGHQLQGRLQLRNAAVTGSAPNALVSALKAAAIPRPSAAERQWIERIELMRKLMLTSPQPLSITDFGAGKGHKFDTGDAETRNVTIRTLGDMTNSSKKPHWAYLLFRIVRELAPESCLELGACVGVSASYQAAALELNGRGKLITLEGADVLAERSERTLVELGLDHRASVRVGPFADTLADAVSDLAPLDYAFIDGNHVEAATIEYMEQLLPQVSSEAILVFDDIYWSEGMQRAWKTVAADERFALTVDMGTIGFGVVSKSATGRQSLVLPSY